MQDIAQNPVDGCTATTSHIANDQILAKYLIFPPFPPIFVF